VSNNPTLYTIAAEFRALEDLIDEQANATEADLDVVARWMDEQQGALETKLSRCVAWIREQESLAQAREDEAKRLRDLAKVNTNRVSRLKEAIKFIFESQGLKKVETLMGNITLAGNGGKQPVAIDDVPLEAIEPRFTKVVRDDEKIRAALEAGESLTFARALPRGSHIRVK
jgi:hypothetical protein